MKTTEFGCDDTVLQRAIILKEVNEPTENKIS